MHSISTPQKTQVGALVILHPGSMEKGPDARDGNSAGMSSVWQKSMEMMQELSKRDLNSLLKTYE